RERASRGARPSRPRRVPQAAGSALGAAGQRAGARGRCRVGVRRAGAGPPARSGQPALSAASALAPAPSRRVMRIAFMHRQLTGGGTEADLRRMAAGLAARGHDVQVFCARAREIPPGVTVRQVRIVRGARLLRLLSFAVAAPRAVARESWDVVVGFGRTPRQDVVRVGGGTHRSYLARMEAAGLRGRARGPYHRAILWIETRQFAARGHRRVLAVSRLAAREVARDYRVPDEHLTAIYNGVHAEPFNPPPPPHLHPPLT